MSLKKIDNDELEEPEESEAGKISLDVTAEFYIRHRDDPIHVFMTIDLDLDDFDDIEDADKVEFFGTIVGAHLLQIIDSRTDSRFVLSDKKDNTYIIIRDEVQAISFSVPEIDTILDLLAGAE